MKKFQTSTIICTPTDVRNQKKMNFLIFKAKPFTSISGLTAVPAQKADNISRIASRVRGREAQIMSYIERNKQRWKNIAGFCFSAEYTTQRPPDQVRPIAFCVGTTPPRPVERLLRLLLFVAPAFLQWYNGF